MNIESKTKINGETPQYETQMATHIIPGETRLNVGRPANPIRYEETFINYIPCMKGIITTKNTTIEILFDNDDFKRVKERQWFSSTGGKYVCCNIRINGERKVLGLHNFIMNRFEFHGKGAKQSVDHINRNGLDNRKCNLRVVSQSVQNTNKKKRQRTAQLPEGITELPKHIWYIKANGLHGDRFCVELKSEKIIWKTTSSKKISIQEKLEQAKKKLEELYAEYPYLNSIV